MIPGVEVDPPTPETTGVNWASVVRWCRRNPGRARWFRGVYANAPYALRQRYPDMKITSKDHHYNEEGKRVCDMWIEA